MNWIQRKEYQIYYQWDGTPDAPVLILSHSLGSDLSMWDSQVKTLKSYFHILRYDHPGHGKSGSLNKVPSIADLGEDILALMDKLGIQKSLFCGLSLGGMVGQWLGANAPGRFTKIAISSTAAKIENTDLLRNRIRTIRANGLETIYESVISNWFTESFRHRNPETIRKFLEILKNTSTEGYAKVAETVCELDLRKVLVRIKLPFLILYGKYDKATPSDWNKYIHSKIANSEIFELDASHMANEEDSNTFNNKIISFFSNNSQ